jgi:hypothetical protein
MHTQGHGGGISIIVLRYQDSRNPGQIQVDPGRSRADPGLDAVNEIQGISRAPRVAHTFLTSWHATHELVHIIITYFITKIPLIPPTPMRTTILVVNFVNGAFLLRWHLATRVKRLRA